MKLFTQIGHALQRNDTDILIRIEPWGRDVIRVRTSLGPDIRDDLPDALVPARKAAPKIKISGSEAEMANGNLRARFRADGEIEFTRVSDGKLLLHEKRDWDNRMLRHLRPLDGGLCHVETLFAARDGEKFYGLGQYYHGLLNQKGAVLDMRQQNTKVSIPFMVSSEGYGFLWNNPALGRVELGANRTRWVADVAWQSDYLVMTGDDYAGIMARYADVTGHPPEFPRFASGFWQCKMRYENQEELMTAAREYKRRKLPLSVIVVDFMHWTRQGDWKWDKKYWPDPGGMIRELKSMGVELMVSVWPTVNQLSENFWEMFGARMLLKAKQGTAILNTFPDTPAVHDMNVIYQSPALLSFYDPSNPEARKFIWDKLKKNYYDIGCRVFWLDACEPDIYPDHQENLRFFAGDAKTLLNRYPLYHQQAVYEGLQNAGEKEIITLCRSGWAGSQRYGAAIWSGDIHSTWQDLSRSIKAGLNMAMSGIPWWTTDIGGFYGGKIEDEGFRELLVRWFQYGAFCPIFRHHGFREPARADIFSGTHNEVWSFGEKAYELIVPWLHLRERLRPYVMRQMRLAHKQGLPPMRPVFFDFPDDPAAYDAEDQFLLGADLLIVPVTEAKQTKRKVYLPKGADWTCAWSGQKYPGGKTVTVPAPIERIPVFVRDGAAVIQVFQN